MGDNHNKRRGKRKSDQIIHLNCHDSGIPVKKSYTNKMLVNFGCALEDCHFCMALLEIASHTQSFKKN